MSVKSQWLIPILVVTYYISVFAKMQFFKISVILCFSVDLLLYFFFSGKLFSAVSRAICTKFGMNASSCMRLKQTRAIFEKLKNQVTTTKKHINFGHFFSPVVTFSLVVMKRLKFFGKSFLRWHLDSYTFLKMYSRWFRTVWFSQSLTLMEHQKRPILRAIISQTVTVTAKVCMKYR